ncbi:MAG TPA: hypothetical protein VLF88_00715 [Candidatus Babeliales bacterium]|nr:hypothetical protein [Candidatus Babeliales bacterium]
MPRRNEQVLLSDLYEIPGGYGRTFYLDSLGFGRIESEEDTGLGNVLASFSDVECQPGESSVVTAKRYTADPASVVFRETARKIIRDAAKSIREG